MVATVLSLSKQFMSDQRPKLDDLTDLNSATLMPLIGYGYGMEGTCRSIPAAGSALCPVVLPRHCLTYCSPLLHTASLFHF